MKYLVAGLGNIGSSYTRTRHNIGFDIMDALAADANTAFAQERYAFRSEFKCKGKSIICIKPTTLMNLSGKAVSFWLQKEKITPANLLVVTDDIALPLCKLRLRAKGGDGGHNGLSHIIEILNTKDFPRLRFGIGHDFPPGCQVEYVLGQWSGNEWLEVKKGINRAIEMIKSFATTGIDRTMNAMNS